MAGLKKFMIMLLAVLVLTGCSATNKTDEKKEEYETPVMMARRQGKEIMEYVLNKDKEGLKSMFSKYILETHDLDNEIDEFFEFIDGEIISYDEPDGDDRGGQYSPNESKRIRKLGGNVNNIKTDKGKTYSISFLTYYIYNSNKDKVGVDVIGVIDEDSWEGEVPYKTVDKRGIGGSE